MQEVVGGATGGGLWLEGKEGRCKKLEGDEIERMRNNDGARSRRENDK